MLYIEHVGKITNLHALGALLHPAFAPPINWGMNCGLFCFYHDNQILKL